MGAVEHMPEDPFDRPHGLIDQTTVDGIKIFQRKKYRVTSGSKPRKEEVEQSIRLAINTTGKTRIIVMVPNVRGDGFVDAEAFKQFGSGIARACHPLLHATQ